MSGYKATDDYLQRVRELFAKRPFVIPAQRVEAWSFPTSATTSGIRSSQNIPLSHVTDLYLLFEATDEFEDALTTSRNTASRRLNPHTVLTLFMITLQSEKNSNGALTFDGLDSNNFNVSIEFRREPICFGEIDYCYNVDLMGKGPSQPITGQ
ncbi:MAG: hypothetical protein EZS28_013335 [Streblomastix strix]|uniref:Uncharacterized protein n=1 Tax=Streblomastix strix TaxID=222440 RepID=A0A5J4W8B5_9EUKA|nr:MAG: hypothetical protein EZS28_013335 [Streblomastix strix]